MELTRDQQQYILDVLARLRGKQLGVTLKFTLKETDQTSTSEHKVKQA